MDDYLGQVAALIGKTPRRAVQDAVDRLWRAYTDDAQIFACGNGGSSATASHFVEDLAKGVDLPPGTRRFRAISLVDSVAIITAYANDMGYEHVFAEPLKNLVRTGDVLIAFSGSGRSPNVLRAMSAAREAGAAVIGIAGRDGGEMPDLADVCIIVPADSMQQIEDAHLVIAHAIYVELKARAEGAAAG